MSSAISPVSSRRRRTSLATASFHVAASNQMPHASQPARRGRGNEVGRPGFRAHPSRRARAIGRWSSRRQDTYIDVPAVAHTCVPGTGRAPATVMGRDRSRVTGRGGPCRPGSWGVLVDPCGPGGGLLRAGEVQVVLPLSTRGQFLERTPQRRVVVEPLSELVDQDELGCRADLEAGLLDGDGLADVGREGVASAGSRRRRR